MKKLPLIIFLVNVGLLSLLAQRGGPPRRVENPQTIALEGGSRIEFKSFQAPSIGKASHYSIFFPPSYSSDQARKFPVVYFLHGMWNDHTSWTVERYGSLPQDLERLMTSGTVPEFIIVQPDGENSFYTDFLDGSANYEQLIHRDLISEVDHNYRTRPERQYRAIGGVSMGGYGSLKVAFKKPDLYSSVAAVSPIIFTGNDPSKLILGSDSRMAEYFSTAFKPVFGIPFDPQHWEQNSIEKLAQSAQVDGLKVFFAYGTADRYSSAFPMQSGIDKVSGILNKRGIEHTYRIYEDGPHGWQLVAEHLEEVARFLSQSF